MSKKLSEDQKKNIIDSFINGESIDHLAKHHKYTKMTITRHLKSGINEKLFKELIKNNKNKLEAKSKHNSEYDTEVIENNFKEKDNDTSQRLEDSFVEIAPLNFEIENTPQKDLSSISIFDANFPKVVYIIVDNKSELEIKLLGDYPDWEFLSKSELNRKTIEIYFDKKIAKSFCNKEQKVIKVPNTNVFRLVSSQLISKGISRIVTPDKLIAI